MDDPIWQMKKQMCEVGRRIWLRGFCAGNEGNHSTRLNSVGDQKRFLCTATGLSKGFLEPDDIVVTDGTGQLAEPGARGQKPSTEIKVHLAIYEARPDVRAVIHSHPPHATAFAISGIPLPEGIHPEAEVFLGKVETARYATPSTHKLPDSILPLIGPETNSVLLGNHGTVSFSNSLTDAYYKLEILDAYCRVLLLAKQVGRVNTLDPGQMTELLKVKQKFGFSDDRLSCAADGCVGEDNEAFLATFDVRPQTAVCDGGGVTCSCGSNPGDSHFESLVQSITDQIVAAAR